VSNSWQVVREGDEDRKEFPWGEITWLANAALGSSPEMTFGKVVIESGKSNPAHSHSNCWELLYLLKGRLRHHFGEESAEMGPGDLAVVPPGLAHWAETVSEEDAVMVVAYSTGSRQTDEVTWTTLRCRRAQQASDSEPGRN